MGVAPAQSAALAQAAVLTQVSSAESLDFLQVGWEAGQVELWVQTTHWPNFSLAGSVSHSPRSPLHATPLSAAVQARHPGVAGVEPSQMIVAAVAMQAPCEFDQIVATV